MRERRREKRGGGEGERLHSIRSHKQREGHINEKER